MTNTQKQEVYEFYQSELRKKEQVIADLQQQQQEEQKSVHIRIQDLKKEHEQFIVKYQAELNTKDEQIASLKNTSKAIQEQQQSQQQQDQLSIVNLHRQYEESAAKLKLKHQWELKNKDAIIETLRESQDVQKHTQCINKLRSHEKEDEENETVVNELRREHEQYVKKIRSQHADMLDAVQKASHAKHKRAESVLLKETQELREALETMMEEKVKLQHNSLREIEKRELELDFFKENVCFQGVSNFSQMEATHKEEITARRAQFFELKQLHRETIKALTNEHLAEVSELTCSLDAMKAKAKTSNRDDDQIPFDSTTKHILEQTEALQKLDNDLKEHKRQLRMASLELQHLASTIGSTNPRRVGDINARTKIDQPLMIVYNAKKQVEQHLIEEVKLMQHKMMELQASYGQNEEPFLEQSYQQIGESYEMHRPQKFPSVSSSPSSDRTSLDETTTASSASQRLTIFQSSNPQHKTATPSIMENSPLLESPSTTIVREEGNGTLGARPSMTGKGSSTASLLFSNIANTMISKRTTSAMSEKVSDKKNVSSIFRLRNPENIPTNNCALGSSKCQYTNFTTNHGIPNIKHTVDENDISNNENCHSTTFSKILNASHRATSSPAGTNATIASDGISISSSMLSTNNNLRGGLCFAGTSPKHNSNYETFSPQNCPTNPLLQSFCWSIFDEKGSGARDN